MDVYSARYNLYDISCIKAFPTVSVCKVFKKAFLNLFICSTLTFLETLQHPGMWELVYMSGRTKSEIIYWSGIGRLSENRNITV